MAKINLKNAPYMVASYARCEDVRKLLAQCNAQKCAELYNAYTKGVDTKNKLIAEVSKILTLEKRVYELERRSFLKDRTVALEKLSALEIFKIAVAFQEASMTTWEIEEYIKNSI